MATNTASIGPWCWRRISMRDRALAGDDVGVVERVHEGQAALALELERVGVGVGVAVAVQHDLAAERSHRVDLELAAWSPASRSLPRSPAGAPSATPCAWLPAEAQITPRCELLGRQVRHLVVGAAQLEAEHRLLVLALEQNLVADAARQAAVLPPAATRLRRRRRVRSGSSADSSSRARRLPIATLAAAFAAGHRCSS